MFRKKATWLIIQTIRHFCVKLLPTSKGMTSLFHFRLIFFYAKRSFLLIASFKKKKSGVSHKIREGLLTRGRCKRAGSWSSLSGRGRWHGWGSQPRLRLHIHR